MDEKYNVVTTDTRQKQIKTKHKILLLDLGGDLLTTNLFVKPVSMYGL